MENLAEYLNNGVETLVKQALRAAFKNPLETAFILRYMSASRRAAKRRLRAEKEGTHIPAFLIASIASQCNLSCAGCYARANKSVGESACASQLSDSDWTRIFSEAEELGISFVLLAGGEPLMRKEVLEAAAGFPDIVFPVFTNGTMLDDDMLKLFHKNRNLVPVLSLEGDRQQTDARRGRGVYTELVCAMEAMKAKGILFGASITVTRENLMSVTAPAYIRDLRELGCKIVLFVEYVPVADTPGTTAPDMSDRQTLQARQDRLRDRFDDMLFVAFPGDEEEAGGCLAAGRGFFHISPTGDAEPCPFSPFSDTSLKTCSIKDALKSPLFRKLELGGYLAGEHLGGCALFAREKEIREL
ncbi:Radical SAM superfamily enzyme, MoaA/NifB/PqqE/SkfB family [Sporobacter termitidis DSM 10068]|uniref:Radical SAM superfamily enzyme, MoaA/NifB/PqqE/SkfB family n=1 Tax=Sporobacter termitidis DSM 10068 TaxID=1123282 RepID=A0A1M5WB40_9FIRM|nr:Radical SAM superfamily enzyme, MoaA/NifB/PqqE/SkfB family [Sporobacter termitidis DSM 10068]